MADDRRNGALGETSVFTVVTAARRPILVRSRCSTSTTRQRMVETPKRKHSLPHRAGDETATTDLGHEIPVSSSRQHKNERGIWQRRFWDRTVRDDEELKRCLDSVRWNPGKHNVAAHVRAWPWSTFPRFVEQGEYDLAWGGTDPCPNYHTPEWNDE